MQRKVCLLNAILLIGIIGVHLINAQESTSTAPVTATDAGTTIKPGDVTEKPAGLNFNGYDISKECYEPTENKTYPLGSKWTTSECFYQKCKKLRLPKLRNVEFAVGVQRGCNIPKGEESQCAVLPKTKDPFPFCCPIEVCIVGNNVNITGTSPDGGFFDVSRVVSNQDMEKLTTLEREQLLQYALESGGYFADGKHEKAEKAP